MHADIEQARAWLTTRAKHERGSGQTIVVLAEQGRGDHARAVCVCSAARRACPDARIVLVGHYDGTMAKRDIAHLARECRALDAYIEAPAVGGVRLSREDLLIALLPHADLLYDAMPIPVGVYERGTLRQMHYRAIYDGYPLDNWRLNYLRKAWLDVATETTGLDMQLLDLQQAAPTDCAPMPTAEELPPGASLDRLAERSGSDNWDDARVSEVKPYVVVHTGAGGDAINKILPRAVMQAVIGTLEANGFPCVQVGIHGEQQHSVQWRRMGLRLPLSNRIIKDALAVVDNEGLLAYMACGLRVPAAVFFSVTPHEVYGLPDNLNIVPGVSAWRADDDIPKQMMGKPRVCPLGNCFWGGGWTWAENWAAECRTHCALLGWRPPTHPQCLNFPRPEDAASLVLAWVRDLAAGVLPAEAARARQVA